jgi:hypothetical protein
MSKPLRCEHHISIQIRNHHYDHQSCLTPTNTKIAQFRATVVDSYCDTQYTGTNLWVVWTPSKAQHIQYQSLCLLRHVSYRYSALKTATVRSCGWIHVRDYSSSTGYFLCKINHMLLGSIFKIIYRKFISTFTSCSDMINSISFFISTPVPCICYYFVL